MKTIKLNYLMLSLLFITAGSFAQTKKLSKNYKTATDVNVAIEARHTNVIIENWDKAEVEIEAYLETDSATKEETKKLLDAWKLETSSSNGTVKIKSSGGGSSMNLDFDMAALEGSLSELPALLEPIMTDLVGPILSSIADNPLPPEFTENMGDFYFYFDAY